MNKSPLGDASSYYRTKKNETGSILDSPELGQLEFYPAGATKPSTQGGLRQDTLREIWDTALECQTENKLYPFGKKGYHIVLHPQSDNRHDRHAVLMTLSAPSSSILHKCDGKDIGFVPKRISKLIHENYSCFYDGLIYKVRNKVWGKYYQIKVALLYGDEFTKQGSSLGVGRFLSIMEE